jgi:hypothetical protein
MRLNPVFLILVASLLCASPAVAQKELPAWEAKCSTPNGPVRVLFHSKSGDVYEDDMSVRVVWRDGSATPVRLRPAWFMPTTFPSNVQGYCSDVGGFELPDGRLLLWLRYSGRPRNDHAAVLLVDQRRHLILDVLPDLGELYHDREPFIMSRSGRFEVLMITEWLLVYGDGEYGKPEWKALSVQANRLHSAWRY